MRTALFIYPYLNNKFVVSNLLLALGTKSFHHKIDFIYLVAFRTGKHRDINILDTKRLVA